MRTCLVVLPIIVFVAGAITASDGKVTSVDARRAEQKFFDAVKAAREEYIADLDVAARKSLAADKLDEAIAIKKAIEELKSQQTLDRGDPVVQLRRRLTNSSWKLVRDNDPNNFEILRFSSGNQATKVYGKKKGTGVWESIEPRVVIAKFNEKLLLIQFDEDIKRFNVAAFGPTRTAYTSGAKVP